MKTPSIYVNGNPGAISILEIDEDGDMRLDVDFGFAVICGSISIEDARRLAHQILRALETQNTPARPGQ